MNFNKPTISLQLIIRIAILILWGVGCYIFFQTNFHYHFFHQEQNQLFLLSLDYINTYFDKPAWLACLASDFLTQFYYYLYAGPAILAIACLTLGHFMFYSLKRCLPTLGKKYTEWIAFAIAIFVMTLEARMALGDTSNLNSIIAFTGGCFIWYIFDLTRTLLNSKGAKMRVTLFISFLLLSTLTYWIFGYGIITMLVLETLKTVAFTGKKEKIVHLGFSIVQTVYILIFVNIVAPHYYLTFNNAITYPGIKRSVDYKLEQTLESCYAIDNEYYLGHYEKVKDIYDNYQGEKPEQMTFYYCLSLEQLGTLAQNLPNMQNPVLGTFYKISEDTPLYTIGMINDLYYLLGDMTYTERAALLANTFSPNGRNARMMKRLAEANLINGDIPAAMKYLRLLRQTLVYKQWAIEHTPETMTPKIKAEIERKHGFINKSDNIRIGDDCYVIMTQLLNSNPKNTAALDYLLCSDMLSHQADVFVSDYEKYGPSSKSVFADAYEGAKSATNNNQE